MLGQDLFRGQHPAVLGFFKEGKSTQVGVGKMDVSSGLCCLPAGPAPDKPHPGANHGMAPAEDIQAGN